MQANTARQLIELNRQFYQTFAIPFSRTRLRLQPGVLRVLQKIPGNATLLDLGSGNGELALHLLKQHFAGAYCGLDFSPGLVAEARHRLQGNPHLVFDLADLATANWDRAAFQLLETQGLDQAEYILAFAVLHHIPGQALRSDLLRKAHALLPDGGCLVMSNWQFLNSERLRQRIQPWNIVSIDETNVDPGDYLLDWRQGGTGLRYVHHFSENELATMAQASGFQIVESFLSDGHSGNLGLYQVWMRL